MASAGYEGHFSAQPLFIVEGANPLSEPDYEDVMPSPDSPSLTRPTVQNHGFHEESKDQSDSSDDQIYATVDKRRARPISQPSCDHDETLAQGWKKCRDEDGDYYWHIRSGTIQRHRPMDTEMVPPSSLHCELSPNSQEFSSSDECLRSLENQLINLTDQTTTALSLSEEQLNVGDDNKQLQFSVQAVGWKPIAETELCDSESSGRAINRSILELTSGRTNEGMGLSGEGKELFMQIDGQELCLIDPLSTTVLSVQPIKSIRVWGVGSQNACDFAYVARDPTTRFHKCHVFRSEVPAKQIANALKEICAQLARERKAKSASPTEKALKLPVTESSTAFVDRLKSSLPSPMDGPSKTKKCHYLGSVPVYKQFGMDVLNASIEKVANSTNRCDWSLVNVTVSPADIKVCEVSGSGKEFLSCRLRFLTFFGIAATDVRLMGMIVHTAQDDFVAHVFHCEPSAGSLCKIVEAACKLRYQKLLDSMPQEQHAAAASHTPSSNKTVSGAMKDLLMKVWPIKKL